MQLTITTEDDQFHSLDVPTTATLENLRDAVQALTNIPIAQQNFLLDGKALLGPPGTTLGSLGVKEYDLLLLVRAPPASPGGPGPRAAHGGAGLGMGGGFPDEAALMDGLRRQIDAMRNNPQFLDQVRRDNPQLYDLVMRGDVQEIMRQMARAGGGLGGGPGGGQDDMPPGLEGLDPMSVEYQSRMEEWIRQKNVEENFTMALEHNPELVIGNVFMLYIAATVNGTRVKAFVDSGAQMTIMGQKYAEDVGIMRLVDKRYQGVARGVGASKIIGRVHQCPFEVGGQHMAISVTILEDNSMDFLLGLDNLKRHQCCIDLAKGELRFTSSGVAVPFLAEHELPKKEVDEEEERKLMEKHGINLPPREGEAGAAAAGGAGPSQTAGARTGAAPGAAAAAPPNPAARQAAAAAAASRAGGAPAAAPAAAPPGVIEEHVAALVNLGFPRDQALRALALAKGNVDAAASILFNQHGGGF